MVIKGIGFGEGSVGKGYLSLLAFASVVIFLSSIPLFVTIAGSAEAGQATEGIVYEKNTTDPFQEKVFDIPEDLKKVVPEDYRQKWSRITGFEYSGLRWGQFVVVYMNDHADVYKNNYVEYIRIYVEDEDVEDGGTVFQLYPVGTIFLKENYIASDGRPDRPSSLTFMIKREKGYDPEAGDWQYIQSDVKGKVAVDGRMADQSIYKLCGECHENMAERDYVFSTFYMEAAQF